MLKTGGDTINKPSEIIFNHALITNLFSPE